MRKNSVNVPSVPGFPSVLRIPNRRLTDFSCRTISAGVNPLSHDRHTGVRPLPSTSTVYDRSLGWSGADCESASAAARLSREDRGSRCYYGCGCIGEETSQGQLTAARGIAQQQGLTYHNIDMSPAERSA